MKVVTSAEMREIDLCAIEDYGLSVSVLMERAGMSVAGRIKELFQPKKTLVIAGGGNNGGDGIVAGRELHNSGWNVKVLLMAEKDKLSPDCLAQFKIARHFGLPMEFRSRIVKRDTHGAVLVDAIFGTGLSKPVKGVLSDVINLINSSGSPVVSVDIPSGVSSDTGEVMGTAIKADYTVTFGLPKKGHLLYPGAEYTGRLFVEDIGFPKGLLNAETLTCQTIEESDVSIPERQRYSHKGHYGHVLLITGSRGRSGAALMSARACLRSGAGLVTIGVPESLMNVMQARVTEEMTLPLPEDSGTLSEKSLDTILEFLGEKADVLAIGPGIGNSKAVEKLIAELVLKSSVPMVIDADGINVLKKDTLKKAKAPVILTPHPGEMARLVGRGVPQIEKDRIAAAVSFAKGILRDSVLVLKGVPTVIADSSGNVYIATTGNPGMAKAGTGDVLTGMIASFLGQGLSPVSASITGVYMHGHAGDIAASRKGLHSLLASDIIEAIPEAFRSVKE